MRHAHMLAILAFMPLGNFGNAYASRVTDAEMASLPVYCADRYKGRNLDHWEQMLGSGFAHTHHYCNALNFLNRYYRSRNQQDKKFNLTNAMTNLDYMVTHTSPSFSLMPEIYASRGLTFSLMNRSGDAIADLNKAIELNPRQPKAFNTLADMYIGMKQRGKALEVISQGLRHNPDASSLKRRYADLGGKLPYPIPAQQPQIEVEAPNIPNTAADRPTPPDKAPVASPEVESEQPKIGSPSNPYCRFCPE